MRTVRTPGVERIPVGIVVHPLFSADKAGSGYVEAMLSSGREEMYITPPAETTLKITASSQLLTNALTMELVERGFKLRELPVQAAVAASEVDENRFA
ncbi:MAG TPA: hypothetical protein VFU38_05030, partial [Candidatus Krumholzibacteria bacterium]|nr:hypothetical protein [Candidatus Krumholzibacteria bacterium]